MRVGWRLISLNLLALALNGLFLLLAVVKVCPWVVPVLLVALWLSGSVWLSCKANGRLPGKARRFPPRYGTPTEPMESL